MSKEDMGPVGEPFAVDVCLPDDVRETLFVTPMGGNLFRMEDCSVDCVVRWHDVIEAEPQADGSLRFLRLHSPSEWMTCVWLLGEDDAESSALSELLDQVMTAGGNWERMLGGILIVHIPPERGQIMFEVWRLLSCGPVYISE
jgi:hypothetical protein